VERDERGRENPSPFAFEEGIAKSYPFFNLDVVDSNPPPEKVALGSVSSRYSSRFLRTHFLIIYLVKLKESLGYMYTKCAHFIKNYTSFSDFRR